MKIKITEGWLRNRKDLDDNAEVSTGSLTLDELKKEAAALHESSGGFEKLVLAFGSLIQLSRIANGFSISKLAQKADIEENELENIENDIQKNIEPRIVYQLAKVLKLPEKKMMQLSGNMAIADPGFSDQVERFAASAKPIDRLTPEHHKILKEFVKYLAEN